MTTGQHTLDEAATDYGFLNETKVAVVAADPATRLFPLLIRFGGSRAIVPANQVASLIATMERGGDYVRDVSIPAGRAVKGRTRDDPEAMREHINLLVAMSTTKETQNS